MRLFANKKGIAMETLAWWILSILILVIFVVGYMMLKDRGVGALEYVKGVFRLR